MSTTFVYLIYASVYSCGALFLVPGVIAFNRFLCIWRQDYTAMRLYGFLALGALFRAIAFILVALWMILLFQSHFHSLVAIKAAHVHVIYLYLLFVWQILDTMASLVLAGVFLLVFNTWAAMVDQVQGVHLNLNYSKKKQHQASTDALLHHLYTRGSPHYNDRRDPGGTRASQSLLKPLPPPRLLFMRFMVTVYLLQMSMFLFVQQQPRYQVRRSLLFLATILLVCCWAVCMILVPVYGERMCKLLDKAAEDGSHRKKNIRRIAYIATVFCFMHTVSLMLFALSQWTVPVDEVSVSSVGNTTHSTMLHLQHIPLHDIVQANPAFFFPLKSVAEGVGAHMNDGFLRWVIMVQVLEFPIEWAMLMALLCVLPSRSALPLLRGYQPILDKRNW